MRQRAAFPILAAPILAALALGMAGCGDAADAREPDAAAQAGVHELDARVPDASQSSFTLERARVLARVNDLLEEADGAAGAAAILARLAELADQTMPSIEGTYASWKAELEERAGEDAFAPDLAAYAQERERFDAHLLRAADDAELRALLMRPLARFNGLFKPTSPP